LALPEKQQRDRRSKLAWRGLNALAAYAERNSRLCYKFEMAKTNERWLLFTFVGGEFRLLSKPFKTKQLAEKARLKYPERQRKTIGLGVIRTAA